MTGSSLTLGTAGSRRTVYLIDDNAAKIADSKNVSTSTTSPANNSTTSIKSNETTSQPISTAPATPAGTANSAPSSTFLMFNRISNIIGNINESDIVSAPNVGTTTSTNNGATLNAGGDKISNNKDKKKGVEDGKETAIWYEYGCV